MDSSPATIRSSLAASSPPYLVLCAVDVHYEPDRARAACAVFRDWSSASAEYERVLEAPAAAPYVPGQLFRRELPPLLAILRALDPPPAVVLVDGYVWLDADRTAGLGAHLHLALGSIPVVGVAKTEYRGAPAALVLRGASAKPLFVSAIGLEPAAAADGVRRMHGPNRLPTMLQRADHLARGWATPIA
jgi:deoxyribonuclease V